MPLYYKLLKYCSVVFDSNNINLYPFVVGILLYHKSDLSMAFITTLPVGFIKSVCRLFTAATLFITITASAQLHHQKGGNKMALLASVERRQPAVAMKKTMVIFPVILKGNEEESLGYIEKFSAKKRDYLIRMYARGKQLLSQAAGIFTKYNLPAELKILLTLESAYNANAVSKAGAVGYWQIMDEVAKEYGMKYVSRESIAAKKGYKKSVGKKRNQHHNTIAKIKDDRKNFVSSTHTAAR